MARGILLFDAGGKPGELTFDLHNGHFLVTSDAATYRAPLFISRAPELFTLFLREERFGISGTEWSVDGRIIFECPSDTLEGTIVRSSDAVGGTIRIPPEDLSFAPGQMERPFRVRFTPVDAV